VATTQTTQRRIKNRKMSDVRIVRLQIKDRMGHPRWLTADLIDTSEAGIGISLMTGLPVGSKITVRYDLEDGRTNVVSPATVKWCTEKVNGNFHAGLELDGGNPRTHASTEGKGKALDDPDWYEVMQLSPQADSETIARVYRILATRYHPDSATGNQEVFVRLCEAHRILSDPELRAQYDARYWETKKLRWKIFDRAEMATSPESERRKRRGVLEALYAKALHDPEGATMSVFEFEELLGCPREHLEAALWYLKGKGLVKRGDNGRVAITVSGFDEVEGAVEGRGNGVRPLLEAGADG